MQLCQKYNMDAKEIACQIIKQSARTPGRDSLDALCEGKAFFRTRKFTEKTQKHTEIFIGCFFW